MKSEVPSGLDSSIKDKSSKIDNFLCTITISLSSLEITLKFFSLNIINCNAMMFWFSAFIFLLSCPIFANPIISLKTAYFHVKRKISLTTLKRWKVKNDITTIESASIFCFHAFAQSIEKFMVWCRIILQLQQKK